MQNFDRKTSTRNQCPRQFRTRIDQHVSGEKAVELVCKPLAVGSHSSCEAIDLDNA